MSLSTPQVESRIQFSSLPQDVEQNEIEVNDHHIVLEPRQERFDWDAVVILLRLALVGILLLGLAFNQSQLHEPTFDPMTPPKVFLESLHVTHLNVSEGEVSSTWEVILTISNVMNDSSIKILSLEAKVSYKENETLAVINHIMPQYTLKKEVFLLNEEETERVYLKLSTTGWEKNQPIVDDTIVQAIAQDMQRGVTRFGLHITVTGEVGLGDGWTETFTMYPKCSNLEVKFVAADEAATIDSKPRECVGLVEWGPITD
ncbi:hypothetical protein CR513_46057, partial [Mucuna pruriens]